MQTEPFTLDDQFLKSIVMGTYFGTSKVLSNSE